MRRWLFIFLAVVLSGWFAPTAHALTRASAPDPQARYDDSPQIWIVVADVGITLDTYEGRQDDPLTLHKYLYCSGNPCNGIDPLGRDMWVGKGNTVLGLHQTFDVGDPKGAYNSYSFGMPGGIFGFAKALVGRQSIKGMITVEVGTKTQPKILYQYGYIRSTPAQDTEVIQAMQKIVGAESDYNLATYNCHTFAQGLFYGIAHTFPNQYIPPPPPVVTYQDFSVISDVDPF